MGQDETANVAPLQNEDVYEKMFSNEILLTVDHLLPRADLTIIEVIGANNLITGKTKSGIVIAKALPNAMEQRLEPGRFATEMVKAVVVAVGEKAASRDSKLRPGRMVLTYTPNPQYRISIGENDFYQVYEQDILSFIATEEELVEIRKRKAVELPQAPAAE